jgi:hypothetical protein
MMVIYKFPEQDRVKHEPEYVVVDEIEEGVFEERESISSIKQLHEVKVPFSFRLLFLMSSLAFGFLAFFLLSMTLLFGGLSLIFLTKNSTINSFFKMCLKGFQKTSIFCLGLFIGTFSLTYGLGLIILFFFLKGEALDASFLKGFNRQF